MGIINEDDNPLIEKKSPHTTRFIQVSKACYWRIFFYGVFICFGLIGVAWSMCKIIQWTYPTIGVFSIIVSLMYLYILKLSSKIIDELLNKVFQIPDVGKVRHTPHVVGMALTLTLIDLWTFSTMISEISQQQKQEQQQEQQQQEWWKGSEKYDFLFPTYEPLLLIILYLVAYIIWLALGLKDPGIITSKSLSDYKFIYMDPESGIREPTCVTCNLPRLLRSHHCSQCNVCVARFDHHCMFANNCVGRENRIEFELFCLICIFNQILFMGRCIVYTGGFWNFMKNGPFDYPFLCALVFWHILFTIFQLHIVLTHIIYNFLGITQYELDQERWKNKHYLHDEKGRFRNKFSRGPIGNLLHFCSKDL